jgi:hypothetical protein
MATIFLMNEEIARGMVCFFHQKKHSYLIFLQKIGFGYILDDFFTNSSGHSGFNSLLLPRKFEVHILLIHPQNANVHICM